MQRICFQLGFLEVYYLYFITIIILVLTVNQYVNYHDRKRIEWLRILNKTHLMKSRMRRLFVLLLLNCFGSSDCILKYWEMFCFLQQFVLGCEFTHTLEKHYLKRYQEIFDSLCERTWHLNYFLETFYLSLSLSCPINISTLCNLSLMIR